jgi:hypothetical protein
MIPEANEVICNYILITRKCILLKIGAEIAQYDKKLYCTKEESHSRTIARPVTVK